MWEMVSCGSLFIAVGILFCKVSFLKMPFFLNNENVLSIQRLKRHYQSGLCADGFFHRGLHGSQGGDGCILFSQDFCMRLLSSVHGLRLGLGGRLGVCTAGFFRGVSPCRRVVDGFEIWNDSLRGFVDNALAWRLGVSHLPTLCAVYRLALCVQDVMEKNVVGTNSYLIIVCAGKGVKDCSRKPKSFLL